MYRKKWKEGQTETSKVEQDEQKIVNGGMKSNKRSEGKDKEMSFTEEVEHEGG